jgi:hypothetical protein
MRYAARIFMSRWGRVRMQGRLQGEDWTVSGCAEQWVSCGCKGEEGRGCCELWGRCSGWFSRR